MGLSFTVHQSSRRSCLHLRADIKSPHLRFVEQPEVLALVEKYAQRPIIGHPTGPLNLQEVEDLLRQHPFVEQVEIYRMHMGDIGLSIAQKEPSARLIYTRGTDEYLTRKGEIMPRAPHFTARVPVLRLPYARPRASRAWNHKDHLQYPLWQMMKTIEKDPFWQLQIAEIRLDKQGEVKLYTQISKQEVVFGTPDNSSQKFQKLYVFYDQILPKKRVE